MEHKFDRRTILGTAVGFLFFPQAFAASAPLRITRLGDGLLMVSGAGGNVVAARTPEGEGVMVDGGLKSRSDELLSLVRSELSVSEVPTLFNTCWQPECTGSNEALGAAGAKIIAHENTKLWLGRDITRPWEARTIMRLPAMARPNQTFYESGAVDLSGREIRFGYMLQAHTDGDMYVHFPEDNVLVTGGVISADSWPLLDWWTGGWLGGLIDGLDVLLEVADEDTRVVPGSGGVLTRRDLTAQRQMYDTIFHRLAEMFFTSRDAEEVLAAEPTKEFDEQFGDPELFLRLAFRGFGLHFVPEA